MQTNLNEALLAVQKALQPVKFDATNPHFKSKYATLPAIRAATIDLLSENGLVITQKTLRVEGDKFELSTTITHVESGEFITSTYPIPCGKPHDEGSAITYARRRMWSCMLGIVTEEDDDGNAVQNQKRGGAKPVTGALGITALRNELKAMADRMTSDAVITSGDLDNISGEYRKVMEQAERDLPDWHERLTELRAEKLESLPVGPPSGKPDG